MPLDSVNFSSEPTVDGNQAKGFLDKLQQTTMQAGIVGAGSPPASLPASGAGNTIGFLAARSDEAVRQFRDTCTRRRNRDHSVPSRESKGGREVSAADPSGDFAVTAGVTYWSVSKLLASRLKGSEATSAEIFATMRELVKFNGKTMAEASRIGKDDTIKVPERYKSN